MFLLSTPFFVLARIESKCFIFARVAYNHNMNVYEILAENLKGLRSEEKLTQQALSDKLQITRANLSRYEAGINIPPLDVLCKYADFFGVTLDYLAGREK